MKKTLKNFLWTLLTLSVLLMWVAIPAHADGVAYIYDKEAGGPLKMVRENTQIGYINYENGYENLILNVVLQSERQEGENPDGMVWIFPVPSKPADIEIDVMQDFFFPKTAKTVEKLLRERLFTLNMITLMSQVYPSILLLFPIRDLIRTRGIGNEEELYLDSRGQMLGKGGVEVHKHVEKLGLTTELITASDGTALETYLKDKGLNFPDDAKNIIQSYIGQNFSFVISWASDLERFYREQTGGGDKNEIYKGKDILYIEHPLQVFVKFKTDRIFFPLKLTSVYGDLTIPIYIYIKGFVTPDMRNMNITPGTNYFINPEEYKVPSEYSSFYSAKTIKNMQATRVIITAKAESFTEDLYFNIGAPPRVKLIQRLTFWSFPVYIVFFILISCISSLIAGLVTIPKKIRPAFSELLRLGLFNCLTLIGVIIQCNHLIERKIEEMQKQDGEENRDAHKYLTLKYTIKKRFCIAFSVLFLILMLIVPFIVYNEFIYSLLVRPLPIIF